MLKKPFDNKEKVESVFTELLKECGQEGEAKGKKVVCDVHVSDVLEHK